MDFITAEDIHDAVLEGRVTDDMIRSANEYLTRLAASFGVDAPEATPMAKRLGAVLACRDCCLALVGTDATVQMDGSRQEDIYERKYKLYAQEAEDREKRLTRADFAGKAEGGSPWAQTIEIERA